MSLVGSLEDLSLGDILQIISLSQKSGVLVLQTTGCDGRLVFVSGLVRGAAIKGGPQDLRGVLVGGGFLSDEDFQAAAAYGREQGGPVRDAIATLSPLTQERIDSLCREAIESAVVTMFGWDSGDFSFDVRSEAEPEDPELLLQTGINAQYLAMEGARQSDETDMEPWAHDPGDVASARAGRESEVQPGFDEMSAHELFGVMPESDQASRPGGDKDAALPAESAVVSLAMATLTRVADAEPAEEVIVHGQPELGAADADEAVLEPMMLSETDIETPHLDELEADLLEASPIEAEQPRHQIAAAVAARSERALVALDDDLVALEWVKAAVKDRFSPVHIFQSTDLALGRIRQYLVRGEPPVVLISPSITVDALAGIRDSADFVARLKSQSQRLVVFWLSEDGSDPEIRLAPANGVLTRPDRSRLRLASAAEQLVQMAERFASQLEQEVERAGSQDPQPRVARGATISPGALRGLRDATRALTEASSRGEILPLVIRFAAEIFNRVAMFMVRDGIAVGMAQRGLDRCGGPDDHALRELQFDVSTSNWMSAVLVHGKPVNSGPSNGGDSRLAGLLGDRIPGRAYMAPIESTGQVIALLYGDNLPADVPIGDTSALEVVLHHAGLALDRAALERALSENESDDAAR